MHDNSFDEQNDRKALEKFILNNHELQVLESEISEFNVFEAIGMVYQEIRHSRFLAFLLNPCENHGLDDLFLKNLLMRLLSSADNPPLSLIEIDVADLSDTFVQTEWRSIDILVVNEATRLVIAIENKISSGEHSDQLARYRDIVLQNYPTYRYIFLFLTPDEIPPSNVYYIPASYSTIASVLDDVLFMRESLIGADVASLIRHYIVMLRRYVVSDSDIAELCRKIYYRHRRALDLILEHRPDLRAEIKQYLTTIIEHDGRFILDRCSKSEIRFTPIIWDKYRPLLAGEGWTPSGRMLLFQFSNRPERLALNLWIGLGPDNIRQAIYIAAVNDSAFNVASKNLNAKWNSIYSKTTLTANQLRDANFDEIRPQIDKFWAHFLRDDFPQIEASIEQKINWDDLEQNLGATGPA